MSLKLDSSSRGPLDKWLARIDLAVITILSATLVLGALNAEQETKNYVVPSNGLNSNNPTLSQATAIFNLVNILTPLVTLLLHACHLYLRTNSALSGTAVTLNPIYTLTSSLIMIVIWATVLGNWIQVGARGRWSYANDAGLYISTGIYAGMVGTGFLVLIFHFISMALSARIIDMGRKAVKSGNHATVDGNSSVNLSCVGKAPTILTERAGTTTPPSYSDSATIISSMPPAWSDRMTRSSGTSATVTEEKSEGGTRSWTMV